MCLPPASTHLLAAQCLVVAAHHRRLHATYASLHVLVHHVHASFHVVHDAARHALLVSHHISSLRHLRARAATQYLVVRPS